MKTIMSVLSLIIVLSTHSAFAFTLEEAKQLKDKCRITRNITIEYQDSRKMKDLGMVEVIALKENGATIGHHYCSVEGKRSQVVIYDEVYNVSAKDCISDLKIYQIRYQQCLEINSLLENEAKAAAEPSKS